MVLVAVIIQPLEQLYQLSRGRGLTPASGGDIENGAGAALLHTRNEVAGGQIDRLGVDRQHPVEILFADIFQRRRKMGDAGIVDENIEMAEAAQHGFRHRGDAVVLRHIDGDGDGPVAEPGCEFAGSFRIDVGDGDARAFVEELADNARAKPGCAAGHQRGLAFKSHLSLPGKIYLPCHTATVLSAENP